MIRPAWRRREFSMLREAMLKVFMLGLGRMSCGSLRPRFLIVSLGRVGSRKIRSPSNLGPMCVLVGPYLENKQQVISNLILGHARLGRMQDLLRDIAIPKIRHM